MFPIMGPNSQAMQVVCKLRVTQQVAAPVREAEFDIVFTARQLC